MAKHTPGGKVFQPLSGGKAESKKIKRLEARIAELEAALRELRDEIIPNWSKREAIAAIDELLGDNDAS